MTQTRNTKQKTALRHAFESADRPLSPEEALNLAASEVKGINLATIYRNIKQLVEDGFLAEVELMNEPSRYELAGKEHHHHFRCRKCDKVFDLGGCTHEIDRLVPRGYRVEEHQILFYGLCKSCNRPGVR